MHSEVRDRLERPLGERGLLGWAARMLRGWLGSPHVPPVLSPLLGGPCSPTRSSPVRRIQGPDMSSQRAPQARRFPIEAGDCPSSAVPPEMQEPVGAERAVGRGLARAQPRRVPFAQTGSLLWQTGLILLPKASSDGLNLSLPWDGVGWLPACLPAAAGRLYPGRQRPVMCHPVPCRAVPCHTVLHHAMHYHIMPRRAVPGHAVPCHAMLAHVRPCHAMPCRAVPCHAAGLTPLSPHRQLRRCPGSHCLTLPNVPIDVFIAMGGSGRPRTT
ncbi:protein FAM229A [Ciconia maguari]